ncbi:alanine racemase [Herbiconiux ginsengi]|uniref:D-serine deaminase, pyridoxal phosphate-dependent n=1 Tax=Herbiconiux ginsengi TaxID=381665 RepID=A0A1H3SBT7_9MICO|nr:alanine racemase [Herbiconiux ginsengi]SDZ35384.1 D-serine deaminase, pyridoxal phosphate-dependent [Herbiconiux ginsengi]
MTLPSRLDLSPAAVADASVRPWRDEQRYWRGLTEATADREPPVAVIGLEALRHNARSMLQRAGGTPIRVASKSIRVRAVQDAVLALPGYAGVLAYTLPEALWLAETVDDVVVGYPTVDRAAIRALAADERLASRVTLMIDSVAHLDLIDAAVGPGARPRIRVAIELDASYTAPGLGRLGVWRSPIVTVDDATALAREVVARRGFALVGMMAYESQIAGVGNRPTGNLVQGAGRGRVIDWMQSRSAAELAERRGAVVAAVRRIAELEFVNGGGTGSLESTSADPSVTEIAAGSGLFGGHLFDTYSRFTPAPAAAFALPVVRKPRRDMATLLGGGWIASGPPAPDRLPQVVWPRATRMQAREMAGEVQTPLSGRGAAGLAVGDRVWLRHTKSGELSEHVNEFCVVEGTRVVNVVPSYRGEGKAFL